ncbi:MAG: synthase epsilon chain, sodium ion specific [Planctomycetota bacterium]|jgi:F-type H+-transporting ATPase subunit epsilon
MATESEINSKTTAPPDLPIRCQVVTPERIVVDEWVSQVVLPLPDGEYGIAKNHDPVIARLGYGSFRMKSGNTVRKFYVDGGFLQIRDNMVSILTNRAVDVSSLNITDIDQQIAATKSRSANSDELISSRLIDLDKLRVRRRLASSSK